MQNSVMGRKRDQDKGEKVEITESACERERDGEGTMVQKRQGQREKRQPERDCSLK